MNALQRVLPKLITDVFYAYQTANGQPAEEVRAAVTFGEYANPSFESQVETVAKAKQGGIMSIEAMSGRTVRQHQVRHMESGRGGAYPDRTGHYGRRRTGGVL